MTVVARGCLRHFISRRSMSSRLTFPSFAPNTCLFTYVDLSFVYLPIHTFRSLSVSRFFVSFRSAIDQRSNDSKKKKRDVIVGQRRARIARFERRGEEECVWRDKGDSRRDAANFPNRKNERVNSRRKNPDGKYPTFARSSGKIAITRPEILRSKRKQRMRNEFQFHLSSHFAYAYSTLWPRVVPSKIYFLSYIRKFVNLWWQKSIVFVKNRKTVRIPDNWNCIIFATFESLIVLINFIFIENEKFEIHPFR